MIITSEDELKRFLTLAEKPNEVAVDTEFLRTSTYRPLPCLLQLGIVNEFRSVDLLELKDSEVLKAFFLDESNCFLLHAASQDLELLHDLCGIWPKHVFDTQLAEAFLGELAQISYAGLVKKYVDVELPKDETLTDWSLRPLTKKQLAYALNDVRYVAKIAQKQREQLAKLGRMSWYEEEFLSEYARIQDSLNPKNAYRRIKRISQLDGVQRGRLAALAAWREEYAQACNKPRRWIVRDETLVACAKKVPHTISDLRRIQGGGELSKKIAKGLLAALAQDQLPKVPPLQLQGGASKEVVLLGETLVKTISREVGIAQEVLLKTTDIKTFCAHSEKITTYTGWRKELVLEPLQALLEGRLGLSVEKGAVSVKKL